MVRGSFGESRVGQRRRFAGIGQRQPVLRERAAIGLAPARLQQVGEGFGHDRALRIQRLLQFRAVGMLTVANARTPWAIDEFGFLLALVSLGLGAWAWWRRDAAVAS